MVFENHHAGERAEGDAVRVHLAGLVANWPDRRLPEWLAAPGTFVVYVFPRMGDPGEDVPAEWDAIPGARGCTPQSCAFRDLHAEIEASGARVVGLSTQSDEENRERAERLHL